MKPSELEAAINEKFLDLTNVSVRDMTDNGGYGLVRWSQDVELDGVVEREHIVHRWATVDTAGNPIPFMLYSGSYFMGWHEDAEEAARADYRARADGEGWAPSARH